MSAIYGMIDLVKSEVDQEILTHINQSMKAPYSNYKIDRYKSCLLPNGVLGYCGQFFTKEAKNEKLPIYEESEKIAFVADAVLDNRQEVATIAMIGNVNDFHISDVDGTIMLNQLKIHGVSGSKAFRGAFAFCYYEMQKGEVYLAADQVASRVLYYYVNQGRLYFSTLIESIKQAVGEKIPMNEKWCAEYLALDSLIVSVEPEMTPYEGIFKILPGEVVRISKEGIRKERYWVPKKYKKSFQKKSDEEYKELLTNLYEDCVTSVLRSAENTGIFLSGGLDSTSVACIAARELQKRKEQLYSFTSIPVQGFVYQGNNYYKANEKEYVELTSKKYPNILCTYLELPEIKVWDDADHMLKVLEVPYKSLQNLQWMYQTLCEAAKKDCRIMLSGQYGNTTVSYGDIEVNFNTLFWNGKWRRLIEEINAFHRRTNCSRKKICKEILKNIWTRVLDVPWNSKKEFQDVYVKQQLIQQYQLEKIFAQGKYNEIGRENSTLKEYRPYMYYDIPLSQIGESETKFSLSTGVLMRDPTRDIRLIELCMNLPENQFVYQGQARRLVREYMSDLLPTTIVKSENYKGLQSADFIHRLIPHWQEIYHNLEELSNTQKASQYLNVAAYQYNLHKYQQLSKDTQHYPILKLMNNALLIEYLENLEM